MGNCGVGIRVPSLGGAAGVNCGTAQVNDFFTSCRSAPGGHNCNVTYHAFGQAVRWINDGALTAQILGSCQAFNQTAWVFPGGLLPVTADLQCTRLFHIPQGECATVRVYALVAFVGDLAPPPYASGPDEVGLCP